KRDWSSDVCSSDLRGLRCRLDPGAEHRHRAGPAGRDRRRSHGDRDRAVHRHPRPAGRGGGTDHVSTRVPVSTYRLQLGPDLTFSGAAALLDHLVTLGITDLYLSPILTAAPGSTHGYDVVDHTRISEVLGGRAAFEELVRAARERDLGIVVDIVPNHMAVPTPASHHRVRWDVLSHGAASAYADWFDVALSEADQVLMPVLGDRIGTALASGALRVDRVDEPADHLA